MSRSIPFPSLEEMPKISLTISGFNSLTDAILNDRDISPYLDQVNEENENEENALFYAARVKRCYYYLFILSEVKCNSNKLNKDNKSILDILKQNRYYDRAQTNVVLKKLKFCNSLDLNYTFPLFYIEPPKRILDIFLSDNVEEFIKIFPTLNSDILVVACQYDSINIAKFCLDNDFGINFITDIKTTALTYACFNSNVELCNLILDKIDKSIISKKDNKKNSPIMYCDGSMSEIIKRIISMNYNKDEEELELKTYQYEDFEEIEDIAEGGYGKVFTAIEKNTKKPIILKLVKDSEKETLIKEICYTNIINKRRPDVCVKIYGLFLKEKSIYLVMEKLEYTLSDIFFVLKKMEDEEKKFYVKQYLLSCLHNIDALASAGIVHFDLKESNIMLDNKNRIKFIDFGLSHFIGDKLPDIKKGVDYLSTFYIKPPADNLNFISAEIFANFQYKMETLHSGDVKLNYDVFSLGSVFANFLFNKKEEYNKYFFYGGNFYKGKAQINNLGKYIHEYEKVNVSEFSSIYGNQLMDLLSKMLEVHSNTRFNAKQCLNHVYFMPDLIRDKNYKTDIFKSYKDVLVKPNRSILDKSKFFNLLNININNKNKYHYYFDYILKTSKIPSEYFHIQECISGYLMGITDIVFYDVEKKKEDMLLLEYNTTKYDEEYQEVTEEDLNKLKDLSREYKEETDKLNNYKKEYRKLEKQISDYYSDTEDEISSNQNDLVDIRNLRKKLKSIEMKLDECEDNVFEKKKEKELLHNKIINNEKLDKIKNLVDSLEKENKNTLEGLDYLIKNTNQWELLPYSIFMEYGIENELKSFMIKFILFSDKEMTIWNLVSFLLKKFKIASYEPLELEDEELLERIYNYNFST